MKTKNKGKFLYKIMKEKNYTRKARFLEYFVKFIMKTKTIQTKKNVKF